MTSNKNAWAKADFKTVVSDVQNVLLELGFQDVRALRRSHESVEFSTSSVRLLFRREALTTIFVASLDFERDSVNVGWDLEPAERCSAGFRNAFLLALEDLRTSLQEKPPGVELSKSDKERLVAFYDAMARIDGYEVSI